MENSRRSKKRSKFFWPEIGLLFLGVLGFNPSLLFNVIGIGSQQPASTSRAPSTQLPYTQQPSTTNPLVAFIVPAIQNAAHSLGALPGGTQPTGTLAYPQQPSPVVYANPQGVPYQQQMQYGGYYGPQYQANNQYQQPMYSNGQWAAANNNYYSNATQSNIAGQGYSSRVPPVEYQNTPASYPTQQTSYPTQQGGVAFPSTNVAAPTNTGNYNNTFGTNVRKEGTIYDDPRAAISQPSYYQAQSAQLPRTQTQFSYAPSASTWGNQQYYNTPVYSYPQTNQNIAGQNLNQSPDQLYWGAVDPRASNARVGTQGSWVPNVQTPTPASSRVVRY